jgi:CBS domain-containing protein
MSPNVMTLAPDDDIVRAIRLMRQERIGAVPIVAGDRLVGILTRSDVLDAFVALREEKAPTRA